MKSQRTIPVLLALGLMACNASPGFGAGRQAPEDKKIITTQDLGVETVFKKYDGKFYDEPSQEPGEVVKLSYETNQYGEPRENWVNVYVPYGYDENTPYNILYFFHGTNETQDSFIGDERAKIALDNMIETGIAKPFLMVFPTYYYDYENRAIDVPAFRRELLEDIMPAVEGQFSTYARSTDSQGLEGSREHRAICGYSRGAYITWHMLNGLLDTAKWWLPMSAAISPEEEMALPGPPFQEQVEFLTDALDAQPDLSYFIYLSCGGPRDMMYEEVTGLVKAILEGGYFSYGNAPSSHNFFYCLSQEVHQTLIARYYLYNAFDVIFQ